MTRRCTMAVWLAVAWMVAGGPAVAWQEPAPSPAVEDAEERGVEAAGDEVAATDVAATGDEVAAPGVAATGDEVVVPRNLAFAFEDGVVRAEIDGETVWRYVLRPDADEYSGHWLHGPVLIEDVLLTCAGSNLYEMDALDGDVLRRLHLPGGCADLERDGEEAVVTVGGGEGDWVWSRTYRVIPGEGEIPFHMTSTAAHMLWLRSQAKLVDPGDHGAGIPPTDEEWQRPEVQEALAAAVERLAALANQDPTNPWYGIWRGTYLRHLGRAQEAGEAYRSAVMDLDPRYHADLLMTVQFLDEVDPALADEAFDRAMTFLLERGYEPEINHQLMLVAILLRLPGAGRTYDLTDDDDWAAAQRLGGRLSDFAPLCEGAAFLYRALRDEAERRGDDDGAARWRERAEAAAPYQYSGSPVAGADRFGFVALLLYALIMGLALVLVVKLTRSVFARFEDGTPWWVRWNPIARWTRLEIVGFVLLVPGIFIAAHEGEQRIAAVGVIASSPLTMWSGDLAHPEARTYMQRIHGSEEADFLHALALAQAGETDAAADLFEAIERYPEARVNLGVMRARQGFDEEARALWREALDRAPDIPEAAHDLGREVASPRVERARRLGIEGPLLAMPTTSMRDAVWRHLAIRTLAESGRGGGTFGRSIAGIVDLVGGPMGLPAAVATWLIVLAALMGILALATLRARHRETHGRYGALGWTMGFLLPGTARQWGPLGPAACVGFLFLAFGGITLHVTGGVTPSPLEALAVPAFPKYFGLEAGAGLPDPRPWYVLLRLWWLVPILNAIYVGVAEWFAPDPAGLVARRRSRDTAGSTPSTGE